MRIISRASPSSPTILDKRLAKNVQSTENCQKVSSQPSRKIFSGFSHAVGGVHRESRSAPLPFIVTVRSPLCWLQKLFSDHSLFALQLDAARQYHVKLMGWVLDWEHVTPPVEPYWSPEKAYLVLPLKEETAPKTATEEAVHTSDLPAEEPGGNKGDETGVEIDWAVVYDAVRPAKEPTPLTDGEGLGVSDSQESRDRPKEGAPVQSESEAPAPFVFSAGTEKTKEPKVEVKEPSVPIEWVAPGQLMTADGLVDVSELREGETLVTAIHTKKEYRLFRVLTDTCLDSPFIYRHREERREWTTFSEYYRTK